MSGTSILMKQLKIVKTKDNILNGMARLDPTGAVAGILAYKSEDQNPLMRFGCGVYQFFLLIETLIIIFFFMSCVAYYQLHYIMEENVDYLDQESASIGRQIAATTLGSFMATRPVCWKVPMYQEEIKIGCYENRLIENIFDAGYVEWNSTDCAFEFSL